MHLILASLHLAGNMSVNGPVFQLGSSSATSPLVPQSPAQRLATAPREAVAPTVSVVLANPIFGFVTDILI